MPKRNYIGHMYIEPITIEVKAKDKREASKKIMGRLVRMRITGRRLDRNSTTIELRLL